ncbi:MAG: hypothetical protein GX556_07695 [Fibrobacter sp.]|nr:hypothetical protein [Fibrobacter sp.]
MKKTPVCEIKDEMVLAREVCGSSGNILLTKGTKLSPALGRRLTNWGISFVYVEGEEQSPEKIDTVSVSPDDLKNQLMEKFANVINNPIMKKLFVAVYQYRLQKSR